MKLNIRLLKLARQSNKTIIFSVFLGWMAGVFGILQAREISWLINQAFLQGRGFETILPILKMILVIIVIRAGFNWAGELAAIAGASRIKQKLRQQLYEHIVELGPAHLRNEGGEVGVQTGELTSIALDGIDALEVYYSQYLPQVALAALVPTTILFFIFPSDLLSGAVMLLTAPLLPLFMYLIGSAAQALTRRQWQGLSRMSAYFLDVLQGLTTLKSLGRSREQVSAIKRVSEKYRQTTIGVLKVTFLSALVLELVATLSTAVVAVEVGVRLLYGRMAFEQAFFVLLLAPEFYLPLRLLGTRFHTGMAGVEAARRLYEVLDLPVRKSSPPPGNHTPQPSTPSPPPSIQLKEVSYIYTGERNALQGVSFDLPAGKMTALVGESGAGKTTITWLLLGFLQPRSGEILVDGKPLSTIPRQEWLTKLAWVPQNPYLFNDTLAANIRLARPVASDAQVGEAARLAHADEFIDRLPEGYDTLVGERGSRLSAGQAQRIALARAFLKDAPVLILDEATSHLDPKLDDCLKESISQLSRGKTVLVIAHHQSTLRRADQVVRLSRGMLEQISTGIPSTVPLQSGIERGTIQSPSQHSPGIPSIQPPTKADQRETHTLAVVFRLLRLLSPFAGRIALSVFLGFATIASSVGLMAAAAYVISAAALHPSIAELQVAIVGVRFFGLSRGVFRYLERLVSHDITFRLLARWRVWFFQALEPLAPARLMQYHSGDLLSRLIADIATLESFYVRAVSPPLVAVLVALTMGIFLGAFHSNLVWILLGFMLLAGLILPIISLLMSSHLGPQIVQQRALLNTLLVDGIQGLPDLLACGGVEAYSSRVSQAGEMLARQQRRMGAITAVQNALGNLLASLGMLSVLAVAAQFVATGRLDGVLLGVVALAALTSFEAMLPLPQAAQQFDGNLEAARRLYELVDAMPAVRDPADPLPLPDMLHLDVGQLSFQYPTWIESNPPGESEFALKNISFSLPPGKHIAIVGPSGAGKTSLVNLLLRYWDYQHGSLQLSGYEVKHYRQDDLRKRVAIISQHTYLFSATIMENLLIARPDAAEADVFRATQAAQLHRMISSLPNGYRSWIGEHGMRLSAGERQRLAIARAFLKDAPLLILDEPTANLDPQTEQDVLASLRELSHGRSLINITQRMVDLEHMDEILVLQDGRIIERGSHEALLSTLGLYRQMWEIYNQIL
jgi:ATP-binding cassette, subfamily C, bacterial CydCD